MKHNRIKVILTISLLVLLLILLVSACNVNLFGGSEDEDAVSATILAPLANTQVLVGGLVQIQSTHSPDITRVELQEYVNGQEAQNRPSQTKIPDTNGYLLQSWTPNQPGQYTLKVISYVDNEAKVSNELQLEVVENLAVSVVLMTPTPVVASEQGTEFQAPTVTPIPPLEATVEPASDAAISVVPEDPIVMEDIVTLAEVVKYPPPPPAPGVPPGPTQNQLPEMRPPVADAADYVSVFTSEDKSQRILISEEDTVAPKVVGGSTVFRAWRIQNTGTATWGPGYELAFYGGRAMGSGGVVFEQVFPGEPARRNSIINGNRLVVPEGKPNQTAILEVMLQTPVTPGIHQSYWRMRNPHGVYFGPIMGVTMDIVRDCGDGFGVYGSPTIVRFEIFAAGSVFNPQNPNEVSTHIGNNVTLDYNIINAEKFDIVIQKPRGETETISTSDPQGRVTVSIGDVGRYAITLYADNGSCTIKKQVVINSTPPTDEQFRIIVIHAGSAGSSSSDSSLRSSATVAPTDVRVEWQHFDEETNQFELLTAIYEERETKNCLIEGVELSCYTSTEWAPVGDPQGVAVGSDAQGAVTVKNIVNTLCSRLSDDKANHQIHYIMNAEKNGLPADPPLSNLVTDDANPCAKLLPTELNDPFDN